MRPFVIAAICFFNISAIAGVPEGIAAFKQGNHAQAWRELSGPARQGDSDAMTYVGMMTAMGVGPTRVPDMTGAVGWYRKAVALGNAGAMSQLGMMYVMGYGVSKDFGKAARLFQEAAKRGNPQAMTNLANLYEMGQGVPLDPVRAKQLREDAARGGEKTARRQLESERSKPGEASFRKGTSFLSIGNDKAAVPYILDAANQGHAEAQVAAGRLFHFGRGVPRDYAKAAEYYNRAMKQGFADGYYHMGYLCEFGLGVPQDKQRALKLYDTAAAKGDAIARQAASNLRSPDYEPRRSHSARDSNGDWWNRSGCSFWLGDWNGGSCTKGGVTINTWDGESM